MIEQELRKLTYTAQMDSNTHPYVIRCPRDDGVMTEWTTEFEKIEICKCRKLRDGKEVAIRSYVHPGNFAKRAISELNTM